MAIMAETVGAPSKSAEGFIAWIEAFQKEIGIPANLKAAGVNASHLDKLVEVATADFCHQFNPRPVTPNDFRDIYREALGA